MNRDDFGYILIVCSTLSIISSLIILYLYSFYELMRGYFNKIILYVAITDLLRCSFIIIPCDSISNIWAQQIIGAVIESTLLISLIWSSCIAVTLYQVLIHSIHNFDKYHKYWFFISFVAIPVIFCIPLYTKSYGVNGPICVFSLNETAYIWRISIDYIPGVIVIFITLYLYIKIYYTVNHLEILPEKKKLIRKLLLYPLIMIIDVTPVITTRMLEIFYNFCGINFMLVVSLSVFSLHGVFNVIIYSSSNSLIEAIRCKHQSCDGQRLSLNYSISSNATNLLIDSIGPS